MADLLLSRCVLTVSDREEIMKKDTQPDRNRTLLNILLKRPYNTFQHLKDALREDPLYKELANKMTYSDGYEPMIYIHGTQVKYWWVIFYPWISSAKTKETFLINDLLAGSHGNIYHILHILHYFCSIRHHQSHLAIIPILFCFIQITFPPKQNGVEDGLAATLWCIMIILVAIRRRNNKDPARRSCCVHPCIRRRPKFEGFRALLIELSTKDPQIFMILLKMEK